MTISVQEILGTNSATIRDHGLKIYELAKNGLKENQKILISFDGINIVISSFLNASIGKLYGDFPFDKVDKKVKIDGLDKDDMELLLDTVIPSAKEYYSDRQKIEKIEKSVMGTHE